jgi:acetyl-CoA synthetase
MMVGLYNDPERYKKTYWQKIEGCYYAGDVASRDEDGFIFIRGRADDVLNIAGHRLGATEIENALTAHRFVNEAAVIGVADKIKGEVAKAFVILNEGWEEDYDNAEELQRRLIEHVKRELGPVAVVKSIEFKSELPKTRSGKIMRRVLKAEETGEDLGDLSALAKED